MKLIALSLSYLNTNQIKNKKHFSSHKLVIAINHTANLVFICEFILECFMLKRTKQTENELLFCICTTQIYL